ncbi:MAG: hypothetical protein JNM93_00700 [Bacteriovoracaceae bacterium]|nr:hypothetical protein [Bacteriovoracaceae bacterium]
MQKPGKTYFQFRKELGIPLFICIESPILAESMTQMIKEQGFEACKEDVLKNKFAPEKLKVLKIVMANPLVAKQIGTVSDLDKYGEESLTPKPDYNVYRFKGVGLMVYSSSKPIWELGLIGKVDKEKMRVVLTRFLSFALASENIMGFWGATVDQGIVIMKQSDSKGEAVFIDIHNHKLFTIDGVKDLEHPFQIMKLDSSLANEMKQMKIEELASLLTHYCTYFSLSGLDYQFKKNILYLAQFAQGIYYPESSFLPRKQLAA